MFKRSQVLCYKVQRKADVYEDYVYDELNSIQSEICERASALENKFTLNIVAGTELYDFPDGLYIDRVIQADNTLTKINLEMVTEIKSGNYSSSSEISYYYKINEQIGFMLADGSAPSANQTIYIYGWRIPKSDGSERISKTVDPILNIRWDYCLVVGAISRLAEDPKLQMLYRNLYEEEFRKQNLMEDTQQDTSWAIPSNSEYD